MNLLSLPCPAEVPELQVFKDIARRLKALSGKPFIDRAPGSCRCGRCDMRSRVDLQAQHLALSGGQTSVAMAINARNHEDLTDYDVAARYGYSFFQALDSECPGVYKDWGCLGEDLWEAAIRPSLEKGVGVVVGLNGEFSLNGRGQVVLIVALIGCQQVIYADPATGSFRATTRKAMEQCPSHPEGKFVFAAA